MQSRAGARFPMETHVLGPNNRRCEAQGRHTFLDNCEIEACIHVTQMVTLPGIRSAAPDLDHVGGR
jgi:hypothetical protein